VGGLWAADGLWIDQSKHILYVGELFNARLWAYDLTTGQAVGFSSGLNSGWLDDFTLSPDDTHVYGANYKEGTIDLFPLQATSPQARSIAQGLTNPTSARFGVGPGFAATSLFVSEGGGLLPVQKDRRVWELLNVVSQPQ